MQLLLASLTLGLEGIANFRLCSPSLPGIYRAGGLEQATAADVANILDGAKIRTIIDLRNDDEIEKSAASASPYGRALLDAYDRGAPVGAGQIASEGSGVLQRLNVPILCDADGFLDEVANRLGPAAKAKAAMVRTFDGKGYDRILYDDIAKKRQLGLYTVMLKTSAEFGNALEAVASRRQSGNVLIHCAKGKDRTGVLAALLQHVAGDDEKDILEAYAASEGLLSDHEKAAPAFMAAPTTPAPRARDPLPPRKAKIEDNPTRDAMARGVDWTSMAGSPPEAMSGTLEWLRSEHGSIDGYLASEMALGDGYEEWRRKLLNAVRLS